MNKNKQKQANNNTRLIDMLDEKSLASIKRFGFVYTDKNTGKTKIRIYKNK